ncbi:hypothetical protein JCM18909_1192 [Cutibacterium acnes JCM 18909]|nr:hypothetical protein JCM18909_1192 [Cutibacterium acnes JCM 18909]
MPFVKQRALSPRTAIRDHVLAALDYIEAHRTRDPRLPAYGHGDWNDSLQPTSASLAEQMCSTWTTELEIHSLETLANALGPVYPDLSKRLRSRAAATREGLTDVFLADGELAGYAIIGNPTMELMVHPRDERTGLHHGILQMIHAISGELLDPLDMKHHLDIIAEYLTGPMAHTYSTRPSPIQAARRTTSNELRQPLSGDEKSASCTPTPIYALLKLSHMLAEPSRHGMN